MTIERNFKYIGDFFISGSFIKGYSTLDDNGPVSRLNYVWQVTGGLEQGVLSGKTIMRYLFIFFAALFVECSSDDTFIRKGTAHLQLGDYIHAQECFEQVVRNNPLSSQGREGLGKALLQQYMTEPSDSSLLMECLTQLGAAQTLSVNPELEKLLSAVWYKRAQYVLNRNDTVSALHALSRSTSFDPKAIGPINLTGIICFKRGEKKKAQELFSLVTTIDTVSASGFFNIAMIYWADSNYADAYRNFLKAAKNSPTDKDILLWAARSKERLTAGLQ
jgi:tetratricopeptide (TPR) repeat protein